MIAFGKATQPFFQRKFKIVFLFENIFIYILGLFFMLMLKIIFLKKNYLNTFLKKIICNNNKYYNYDKR